MAHFWSTLIILSLFHFAVGTPRVSDSFLERGSENGPSGDVDNEDVHPPAGNTTLLEAIPMSLLNISEEQTSKTYSSRLNLNASAQNEGAMDAATVEGAKDDDHSSDQENKAEGRSLVSDLRWLFSHQRKQNSDRMKVYVTDYEDISCKDNCGSMAFAGCSCHVMCKVTGACCHDFETQCPQDSEKIFNKFWWFKYLHFTCRNGIYMVDSCPAPDVMTQHRAELNANPNSIEDKENEELSISNDNNTRKDSTGAGDVSIKDLPFLENFPVTDAASGVTFVSPSVYRCHQHLLSAPVYWEATFSEKFTKTALDYDTVSDILDVSDTFQRTKGIYSFSLAQQHLKKQSICYHGDVVNSCPEDFNNSKIIFWCESNFTTFLTRGYIGSEIKNPFCFFCNYGFTNWMYPFRIGASGLATKQTFQLSVTMKLDASNQHFVLENDAYASAGQGIFPTWQSQSCDTLSRDSDLSSAQSGCSVTSCAFGTLDANGKCEATTYVEFCLPEAEYPLCSAQMTNMVANLRSFLERRLPSSRKIAVRMVNVDAGNSTNAFKYNLSILIEDTHAYHRHSVFWEDFNRNKVSKMFPTRERMFAIIKGVLPKTGRDLWWQCKIAIANSYFRHTHDKDLPSVGCADTSSANWTGNRASNWFITFMTVVVFYFATKPEFNVTSNHLY